MIWRKWMRLFKKKGKISRAQALVELALILPVLMMTLFVIIELGRLFHAWLVVENGARFGIRYAVTGEYDPANCPGGATAEGDCINPADEVPARVASIHEVAWAGSSSILRKGEGEAGNIESGYFHVVVCKPENLISPEGTFDSYSCYPIEDPGEAGVRSGVKLAAPLFAAVGVDATSSGRFSGDISQSHTTGTGQNRLMLVGISVSNWPNTPSVSSATYGGQALTLVGSRFVDGEGVLIYSLKNPTSGAHNVVIDYSSNPSYGSVVGVMTFSGVDQTNPLRAFASATGTGSSASVSVSSASGELVFDTLMNSYDKAISPGASQTQRWNNQGEPTAGGSTKAGAASVTMSWSWSFSNPWVIGAVSIKPASSTPTATPTNTSTATFTPTSTSVPSTATYTPTKTPTSTPSTPTATHTQTTTPTPSQTPTSTGTPTPTPVTGVDPPAFPACPAGLELLGTYADYIRRDIEPTSHSYPFSISEYGDVLLQGWVMEGHPDRGCPGDPSCDEYQDHEDIIFQIDGSTLGIYEDEEHGPYENAWYSFGPMQTALNAGSHTLTFRHTMEGEDAESVGYRFSLCGPPAPTSTPTLTPTSTHTPTKTPTKTPTNTSVPQTNTPMPPTSTPTITPTFDPNHAIEDPGEPGDRVVVVVEFNHPLIMPILSSIWPELRLTAMREGIVETWYHPRAVGTPLPYDTRTPRPTVTPKPTTTPKPTNTSAAADTPTMTSYDPRCDMVWISGVTANQDSNYIQFEIHAYDWNDWPEVVNYRMIVDEVEIWQDEDAGPWVVTGLKWEAWDESGTLYQRYDPYGDDWYYLDYYPDPPYEEKHCLGAPMCGTLQYNGRMTIYFGQTLQGEYGIFPTIKFPDYGISCRKWVPWTSPNWVTDTPVPSGPTPGDPTASPVPPTAGPPPPTSGPNPTSEPGDPEGPPD
jgi:hypothetical protein